MERGRHPDIMLRVANACHPDMPDAQRREILRGVVDAECAEGRLSQRWAVRLRRRRCDATVAGELLSDLEGRCVPPSDAEAGAEGFDDEEEVVSAPAAVVALLLMVAAVGFMLRLFYIK